MVAKEIGPLKSMMTSTFDIGYAIYTILQGLLDKVIKKKSNKIVTS